MNLTARRRRTLVTMDAQRITSAKSSLGDSGSSSSKDSKLAKRNQQQFSSIVLFVSLIILINLCPFQQEAREQQETRGATHELARPEKSTSSNSNKWNELVFSNPIKLGQRNLRYTLAEARVLGKMAKVWYIKKKIKKLSKKLKKHTIAVPVFTAIPIYEHSYYPQPHVTHVSHGAMHHHAAAASSYAPTVAQFAATPATITTTGSSSAGQQLATSASNNHQMATYRLAPAGAHHGSMYHHSAHHHPAAAHQIINAYAPSPPLYVDEAGGLYGHYGNAYGRYDGGYQIW